MGEKAAMACTVAVEKVICELHRVWQNKDSLFNPTLTKAVKDAELSIVNARMLKEKTNEKN